MKHLLITLVVLCISVQVFAQDNPSSGQIKVYDSYQPPKGSTQTVKNKIAINPLCFFIGDYSIFYERMFGQVFSVEASVGITYENFFYNNINLELFDSYATPNLTNTYQTGFTYSIAPKIYLSDDDFEGWYLSLYIRNRTYNSTATGDSYGKFTTPLEQYYKLNTVTFNFGHSYHLGNNIVLDYYGGLGLRFTTLSQAEETPTNYNSGTPYTNPTYEVETTKKTTPTGCYGIRIGYIF